MTRFALALLLVAVAQWLVCWTLVLVKPRTHVIFLTSSAILAVAMFVLAPGASGTGPIAAVSPRAAKKAACAQIKEGISAAEVRETLGEPSSVVNEEDTQGPGAEAWLYAETGCVVRILDNTVRAVDFESTAREPL